MSNSFERFRRAIKPFLNDRYAIDLKVIAQHSNDGRWIFNSIRATLDPSNPDLPTYQDIPSIPNLFVAHERWSVKRFDELLDSISKGELTIRGEIINVKRYTGQEWQTASFPSFYYFKRDRCRSEFGINFASYVLRIWESTSGAIKYEELEPIDSALRSSEKPWDGLTDLRENFIGLDADLAARSDGSILDIIAPLGVRLADSSALDGQTIRSVVERSFGTDPKDIDISVISYTTDNSIKRLRQPAFKIGTTDISKQIETIINLAESPSKVKLILTYKGIDVDRIEIFGKPSPLVNPRAAVFEELVEERVEGLARDLESKRGRDLESGIALLWHLLSFSSCHYGITSKEVPDIIAFSDSGTWFLVVECTESGLDSRNKLTKLATRTKKILQTLRDFQAYPVIVTMLNRSMINATDLEKAATERIAVVTADEIPNLIKMVIEGAKPPKVRDYLTTLIPYHNSRKAYG